jgi:hypothetical protein
MGRVREDWLSREAMSWSDGILECWNTEDTRLAERDLILDGRHAPENKIRPISTINPQYAIFSSFHYATGYFPATATPLSELWAQRAGSWGEVKVWAFGPGFFAFQFFIHTGQ